ncbi:hypothetical protein SBA7_1280004 [Candidatus Sulfotelmatobacter sp. SbA7]|nr:hypothetical protein SBA7_1280004 [Candidatus Sulfotelmatobacter sp. SbA7]
MRDKTVFVLGAGFSYHAGIPLVQQLRTEVLNCIDRIKVRDLIIRTFLEPMGIEYPEGKFRKGFAAVDHGQGIEELLVDLRGAVVKCPVALQTLNILRRACARLLWEEHYGLRLRLPDAYSGFAHRVASAIGVISFNWDLVCETALEREGRAFSYAPDSRIPIIKPHGSINWTNHLQPKPGRLIENPSGMCPIADGMTISWDQNAPFDDPLLPYDADDLRYMIFPGDPEMATLDSDEARRNTEKLWEAVAALILRAEEVVFIGYSLPAYDQFAKELFQCTCHDKRIVVCNPSPTVIEAFEQAFSGENIQSMPLKFEESVFSQSPTHVLTT